MRIIVLQLVAAICSVQSLENPVPSTLLQPRNYNPHPYKGSRVVFVAPTGTLDDFQGLGVEEKFGGLARAYQNTGPIRFPESPDSQQQTQQQLEQRKRIVSHIVEKQALIPHPYEKLALNYRSQQLERFAGQNDRELPQIYSALAQHARKVKNNEFQRNLFTPHVKTHNRIDEDYQEYDTDPIKSSSSNHQDKNYRFSYAVKDKHSGDDFSHTQNQENGAVHGSYKVQLPDGRVQIVKYTADDVHGYRAEVSYEGVAQPHPTQPQTHYPQAVTPTPYQPQYNNVRAPPPRSYFVPTTASSRHHYY